MGTGQSVHLVVQMWKDIPPAKLKVKKMTPLVASISNKSTQHAGKLTK